MSAVGQFGELFAGRHDCYGEAVPHPTNPRKVSYIARKEPLTEAVLIEHLKGTKRIGVYPLVAGYVQWFAVDLDADNGEFETAWVEAVEQLRAFERHGLLVYLERSRSGDGVHCWGFLEEPIEAALVLSAIRPLIIKSSSQDLTYPVQSAVDGDGFGNLLALPFHGESLKVGCTAFLDPETREPIPPPVFLREAKKNARVVIEELAAKAPKPAKTQQQRILSGEEVFQGRPDRPLSGVLKLLSPFGCKFMHHCVKDATTITQTEWFVALGQLSCFQHGRDAAHLLSALDPVRYSPEETDALYDRVVQTRPHGCQFIHANFPEHACQACPMKAPYHRAKTPVGALVGQTVTPLVKQDWGRAIKRVRDRNSGVERTGLLWRTAGLDHYTRLRQGEFIIVGARPSMGKTGFLVDAALNIAESGTPVMVFSAETGEVALSDRFLARATGIDSKRLRGEGSPLSPDDERCLAEAANALDALPLYVNYAASNAEQILALVERAVLGSRIPLDADFVVFMDYLQFGNTVDVTNSGEKEYTRVTRVSSEFKAVSMILNRPFVAFSQLNRDGEDEEEPTLALLRATGQLEQDANVVMILSGTRTPGPISRRNLFLLKDKEGEAGHVIDLVYHQAICHFEPTANLKNSDPASTAIPSLLDGVL